MALTGTEVTADMVDTAVTTGADTMTATEASGVLTTDTGRI